MNVLAEIKVSYNTEGIEREKITSCRIAYNIILDNWNKDTLELQEEFKVLLLDRGNKVLGIYALSKGGISGTVVDVKLLFAVALKCNSSCIIICHNHPSGNLNPSDSDIKLTEKIIECAELLDIEMIDHLIITKNGFYSFKNSRVFLNE